MISTFYSLGDQRVSIDTSNAVKAKQESSQMLNNDVMTIWKRPCNATAMTCVGNEHIRETSKQFGPQVIC